MAKNRDEEERETTYSGEAGERERSTPGRSGPGQHKSTSRGDLDR